MITYRPQYRKYLLVILGMYLMTFLSFGEEIIELEVGKDADPVYATFVLEDGESYLSDDPSVARVSLEGVVTAINYGETYVHILSKEKTIKSYLVIVYRVQEEETPFARALILKPFLKGYPDKSFKPDQFITTGEASAMLCRALNIKYNKDDSTHKHWAYGSLQSLVERSLLTGDLTFLSLEEEFTRFEFKKFLLSYGLQENLMINEQAINELSSDLTLTRGEMVYYLCLSFNQEPEGFTLPKASDVKPDHKYFYYIHQNYQ